MMSQLIRETGIPATGLEAPPAQTGRPSGVLSLRMLFLLLLALLGIALRLICASRGHNYDVDSYQIVANILRGGGNVYEQTARYNYAPVWFTILHWLDLMPWFGADRVVGLRWKVAVFLSLVDVGIFAFLTMHHSWKTGALFLLNPISIIITGYHSQFGNLAVLVGLISVAWYEKKRPREVGYGPLLCLGLSLCVKHILFLFPLWLAFKAPKQHKRATLLIPYLVFFLSFVPFLPAGTDGIIRNVFLYRSFPNEPLWTVLLPDIACQLISPMLLFCGSLFLLGLYFRNRSPLESLYLYLIALVAATAGMANQYLAICSAAIAVLWNPGYLIYSVVGTLYLLVDYDGMHIASLQKVWQGRNGYALLATLLALGFFITVHGRSKLDPLIARLRAFLAWIRNEILLQTK